MRQGGVRVFCVTCASGRLHAEYEMCACANRVCGAEVGCMSRTLVIHQEATRGPLGHRASGARGKAGTPPRPSTDQTQSSTPGTAAVAVAVAAVAVVAVVVVVVPRAIAAAA